jgi:hypothetical protein
MLEDVVVYYYYFNVSCQIKRILFLNADYFFR